MRCKNCGFENDDKLFICENCGSPLYDENEPIVDTDSEQTQVIDSQAINSNINNGVQGQGSAQMPEPSNDDDDDKKKKQAILIIVLIVILVVIVAGVVFGIVKSTSKNDPTTTKASTSTTVTTTENKSQTTTKPTETTTQASFAVGVSCNAGGSVSGDGIYKLGENATVVAKVDDGYNFDGWYKGSTKVSSNTKYTFTVTENISLKAVFKVVETESTTQEPTPSTEPETQE